MKKSLLWNAINSQMSFEKRRGIISCFTVNDWENVVTVESKHDWKKNGEEIKR